MCKNAICSVHLSIPPAYCLFSVSYTHLVAEETLALTREMDLSALAKERVLSELEKALLKAPKPSVFFQTLRAMDQLSFWFPEVQQLIGVVQSPLHHPEGDVWNHTMLVLDEAAKLRGDAENPLGFLDVYKRQPMETGTTALVPKSQKS